VFISRRFNDGDEVIVKSSRDLLDRTPCHAGGRVKLRRQRKRQAGDEPARLGQTGCHREKTATGF
jgi:hypothetical protein